MKRNYRSTCFWCSYSGCHRQWVWCCCVWLAPCWVCSRDEGVQLACLKLVHALLRQLKTDDIVTLLPTLATFVDSRSVACRAAVYDIFMWLYDNFNSTGLAAVHSLQFSWLIACSNTVKYSVQFGITVQCLQLLPSIQTVALKRGIQY